MIYLYANENSTAFVELENSHGCEILSRPHNAVIRIYVEAGNVLETHEHAGDFKEWWSLSTRHKRDRNLVNVAPFQLE